MKHDASWYGLSTWLGGVVALVVEFHVYPSHITSHLFIGIQYGHGPNLLIFKGNNGSLCYDYIYGCFQK